MTKEITITPGTIELSSPACDFKWSTRIWESTCASPGHKYFISVGIFSNTYSIRISFTAFYVP